jgi:hypothetical protein
MKPKNLRKKIRRLEKRLQEGTKKLARLREKLKAAETAKTMKAGKKSAGPARTKQLAIVRKTKRKLNLSPERRAQLAAAMKARWAAKRAAEADAKADPSDNQHSAPGPTPQAPESRPDGA